MVEGENGATEQKDLATVLGRREEVEAYVTRLIARLRTHLGALQNGGRILDVGAAQGLHVSVLRSSGYDAHGVEPWPEAVELADAVARALGVDPAVVGEGEALPFESGSFDLVIMVSVLEHVADPDRTLAEANRVLRPGGGLYLSTNSALCPRQPEIRRFPCFSWYPDSVKRRIMTWARDKHPGLIGYTSMPAMNWYTPRSLGRALRRAGFGELFDRWELKRPEETSGVRASGLRAAQRHPSLRFLGDVAVPGQAFLAVK
jgi:SAM-dependent methyltransferase